MFGTLYVALKPLYDAMRKNIGSAIAVVALVTGVIVGTSVVLRAMLGIQ